MRELGARSASRTASSTVSRSTPGMEATGSRRRRPSIRKSGQIRSSAVSTFSRTSRRDHSALRLRRGRWVREGARPRSLLRGRARERRELRHWGIRVSTFERLQGMRLEVALFSSVRHSRASSNSGECHPIPPRARLTPRRPPSKPRSTEERAMARAPKSSARRQGAAGSITLNRPQALNALTLGMVREMRRRSTLGRGPAVTRIVVTGRRREGLLRRRRHPEALRPRPGPPGRGARVLARGIRAQRPHQALPEALCRAHRRHRHGRRGRRVAPRQPPGRGRAHRLRDAGGRHRLLPRCRRDLRAAAPAGPDRHLSRADGRPGPRGRRPGARAGDPCGPLGASMPLREALDGRRAGRARSRRVSRPRSAPSRPIVRRRPLLRRRQRRAILRRLDAGGGRTSRGETRCDDPRQIADEPVPRLRADAPRRRHRASRMR